MLAHIIPILIYKRKELKANPKKVLYRLFIAILKSFAFISTWGIQLHSNFCFTKQMRTNYTRPFWGVMLGSTLSMLGIFFESAGKIEETVLYCAGKTPDLVWDYLKKKYNVKSVPMFCNIIFALSTGIFCSVYLQGDKNMKSKYKTVGDILFKNDESVERPEEQQRLEIIMTEKKNKSC